MTMHQSWISYFSNLVKKHGGINLAQGIPGFQPPDGLIKVLKDTANENIHQYAPGTGNLKLREQILKMYKEKISDKDFSLLITNGGTEAIHLLYFTFHKEKNKLKAAAFAPVYESYLHLPRIHGDIFKSINIDNNDGKLTKRLQKFFSDYNPDVFFANSPGNPHGKSLDKTSFDTLIRLSQEYNCKLIIDAVYDRLFFNEPPYYPFDKFHKNTFYINSFSKLFSITGWRLGYLFCHNSVFDTISDVHDYTGLSSPSVLQESLAEFMKNFSESSDYIEKTRSILKNNYQKGNKILSETGFRIPESTGGYFIWGQLPDYDFDSIEFSKKLYNETKTAVIPGEHFGKDFSNFIRINIARPEKELNEGLLRIRKFIKQ